jgi:hypothetical protein
MAIWATLAPTGYGLVVGKGQKIIYVYQGVKT